MKTFIGLLIIDLVVVFGFGYSNFKSYPLFGFWESVLMVQVWFIALVGIVAILMFAINLTIKGLEKH